MPDYPVSGASPDFLSRSGGIDDPRQTAKIIDPLNGIFLLVACAVISGAQDWVSRAPYGQKKLDPLRRFLPFEDATPGHDQSGILFSGLDMEDLWVMTWIQGITDFLVWVLFPALVLRRICFAFLVYAIGGVFWMSVILFAALRRFCAMAAMTICAWVLATPKQRARCRTKRRFIVPRHCSTRNRRLEICLLKRFSD